MESPFRTPLLVGKPNIGSRETLLRRIEEMLDRRWFSNAGPLVQEFEAALCRYVGVKHCVAVCNATVGLDIAAHALDLQGEVIVPAYTFVATAHALRWQAITPVFADMDPVTHCVDVDHVERLISPRTSAIVATHVWGHPCDMLRLEALAREHGIHVMYDAAHAFGCSFRGKMLGGNGACEVFSFHATKFLNSFEGGAIATNDDALAERCKLMRNFGFAGFDNAVDLGTNGKMTEVCAAMGLTSLECVDELISANRERYDRYVEGLHGKHGLRVFLYDPAERNNYQYIVVEVDEAEFGVSRDELVDVLHRHNVIARKYFWPGVHRFGPYRHEQPNTAQSLPVTERIAPRVVVLPTGPQMSTGDVDSVCRIITGRARR